MNHPLQCLLTIISTRDSDKTRSVPLPRTIYCQSAGCLPEILQPKWIPGQSHRPEVHRTKITSKKCPEVSIRHSSLYYLFSFHCVHSNLTTPGILSSVQSLSRVRLFETPWIAARQASLSITNSWGSLKLMSIKSVMPSSHLILCHPLLFLSPIPPSIRVFSNESTLCMRWSKYWSFSFSIIPSKEHPGLISFRMDWLDLLAVQGTLKSLLQHHSSKAWNWGRMVKSTLKGFREV